MPDPTNDRKNEAPGGRAGALSWEAKGMDERSGQIVYRQNMEHASSLPGESERVELLLTELEWTGEHPLPRPFYMLDGRLTIRLDGRLFFDAVILPLELSQQLAQWQALLKYNIVKNFIYSSIEADENVLLEFRQVTPEQWAAFSPWQEFKAPHNLTLEELVHAAQSFQDFLGQALAVTGRGQSTDPAP